MRRIDSIADQMNDVVRFELPNGQLAVFAGQFVRDMGLAGVRDYLRIAPSDERLPVEQAGRIVGTLPADFDPLFIKSTNWLYDPRAGDFKLAGDRWIACPKLGPGDLDAVPGFVWERAAPSPD